MTACVAGIDPGRDKCGLAVVAADGTAACRVWLRRVVLTAELDSELAAAYANHPFSAVVLGNGTTSGQAEARIRASFPAMPVHVVDEYKTTELARREYWRVNPRSGWRRLVPETMLVPPEPVDDLVAVILARRYLAANVKTESQHPTEE